MNAINDLYIKASDFKSMNEDANVYWLDKNGNVLDCNDTQLQSFIDTSNVKTKLDVIGNHISALVKEHEANIVIIENNIVMNSKIPHLFLNCAKSTKDKIITYLSLKTPLYNNKDEIVGIWGISIPLSKYPILRPKPFEKLSKRESV